MILLQYSKDFRKIGIILSIINIILQEICIVAMAISFQRLTEVTALDDTETFYYTAYREPVANILLNAIFFFVADTLLYAWLIYGLSKRRPGFLLLWLIYSIAELLIIETALFILTLGFCVYYNFGLGILSLAAQLLVTLYLFSNMCVIYTAYDQFLKVKPPQVNPNVMSNSPVQVVQYTAPQYVVQQPQFAATSTAPTVSYPSHMAPNYEYSKTQQPLT